MPKIFISYRRSDSQDFTDRLFDYMVKHFGAENVFQDVGDNTKIPLGVDFVEYLAEQVRGCDVVLVVIGEQWARILNERANRDDDFVRIEVESALRQGKVVIPVLKSGTQMPGSVDLPESIRKLARLNASRVRPNPDFVRDCDILADGIRNVFDRNNAPTPPASEQPKFDELVFRHLGINNAPTPPTAEQVEVKRNLWKIASRARPTSLSLLPAPFAWIEIPEKGYSIAKYPVTNAQFAKFIEGGGYNERKWWTYAGWTQQEIDKWTQPRYWNDSKWNGAEQPVVGVSWYESVAFCLWLSDVTGEKIVLPTEYQWRYAAQGDDERAYPWGNDWDASRCNNNVGKKGIGKTTPVTHYEGKGDSPFGVVDMAGNVLEWCLTNYENKTNAINSIATYRMLRGGSWNNTDPDYFRCDYRSGWHPHLRYINLGFRLARS